MGIKITLYTKGNCPLCDKGYTILEELKEEFEGQLEIKTIDIYKDEYLIEKYGLMIPVVIIDGDEVDYGMISKAILRERLHSKCQC
jgi:glutaredoxin